MTLEDLLCRLNRVTRRGSRYIALCPVHDDHFPSFQVTAGEAGLLVKCWAGCTLPEICAALGVSESDLFYDAGKPRNRRSIPRKPPLPDRSVIAFQFELAALDRRLRADKVLTAAKNFASLTAAERDRLMKAVASAYADLETADLFKHVSDTLRWRAWQARGGNRHAA